MVEPLGGISFTWPFVAAFIIGYLFGSIPSGLLLTRVAGLGDIRNIGSGNIGTTNVLRTGRKDLAALTLLFDFLKGAIPVWLGWRLGQDIAVLVGLGAVIGHCFPVWLKFRGGKAVATAAGVLMLMSWPIGLSTLVAWLACAFTTRIASLSALFACVVAPIAAWLLAYQPIGGVYYSDMQRFQAVVVIALLVIWRHHHNIRRLLAGQEPRIGASSPAHRK